MIRNFRHPNNVEISKESRGDFISSTPGRTARGYKYAVINKHLAISIKIVEFTVVDDLFQEFDWRLASELV